MMIWQDRNMSSVLKVCLRAYWKIASCNELSNCQSQLLVRNHCELSLVTAEHDITETEQVNVAVPFWIFIQTKPWLNLKQRISCHVWDLSWFLFLCSWVKRDQLDVTCFIISLFNAQRVSDVNTSILRSLRFMSGMNHSGAEPRKNQPPVPNSH